MDREELGCWLRLLLTPGVGNTTARRLLSAFGPPDKVFGQSTVALRAHASPVQAEALQQKPAHWLEAVDRTWQWLQGSAQAPEVPQRTILTLGDPRYPSALLEIDDPPLLLYAIGPAHLLGHSAWAQAPCLAVVGSRNPTAQGSEHARLFAHALHAAGLTVVSGLALGIDAAAHEGALDAAQSQASVAATIAVVGTGLDRVYPKHNHALAKRIAAHGVLLSEYPLGTPPIASNFPKRNRIISGLSKGTLVVEAALASGSLITARMAAEQGREVFAIPGSIHAPQSRGCHALIRQGAKLVETAADILEELWGFPIPDNQGTANNHPRFDKAAPDSPLLHALGFDPVGLDQLVARTGMDAAALQAQLLELELEQEVARLPGGLFQRTLRA